MAPPSATGSREPGGIRCDRGVVVGNVYDKYGTRNPVARLLMHRFLATVDALTEGFAAESLLEVGCGEGHLLAHLRDRRPERRHLGTDLSPWVLAAHGKEHPGIPLAAASICALPFADRSFDAVLASEVLEHLDDPRAALRELLRVTRRHLLLSVPDEPLWRILNCARGRYLGALGNTPGHLQHWSRKSFVAFVERQGQLTGRGPGRGAADAERRAHVTAVRSPLPWTVVAMEVTP